VNLVAGVNSFIGDYACIYIVNMNIPNDSCVGYDACEYAANSTVGRRSCYNDEACDSINMALIAIRLV